MNINKFNMTKKIRILDLKIEKKLVSQFRTDSIACRESSIEFMGILDNIDDFREKELDFKLKTNI